MKQAKNQPVLVAEAVNVDTADTPIEYGFTRFAAARMQLVVQS